MVLPSQVAAKWFQRFTATGVAVFMVVTAGLPWPPGHTSKRSRPPMSR